MTDQEILEIVERNGADFRAACAELIALALGPDFPLDEPVTSGGDSVVWDKGGKP